MSTASSSRTDDHCCCKRTTASSTKARGRILRYSHASMSLPGWPAPASFRRDYPLTELHRFVLDPPPPVLLCRWIIHLHRALSAAGPQPTRTRRKGASIATGRRHGDRFVRCEGSETTTTATTRLLPAHDLVGQACHLDLQPLPSALRRPYLL